MLPEARLLGHVLFFKKDVENRCKCRKWVGPEKINNGWAMSPAGMNPSLFKSKMKEETIASIQSFSD